MPHVTRNVARKTSLSLSLFGRVWKMVWERDYCQVGRWLMHDWCFLTGCGWKRWMCYAPLRHRSCSPSPTRISLKTPSLSCDVTPVYSGTKPQYPTSTFPHTLKTSTIRLGISFNLITCLERLLPSYQMNLRMGNNSGATLASRVSGFHTHAYSNLHRKK